MRLLKGRPIVPKNIEDFQKVCEELGGGFIGSMRLKGTAGGREYQADILVERGDIIAASIEHPDDRSVKLRDEAVEEIENKLGGSKGKLEVSELTQDELNATLKGNEQAVLKKRKKITSLKLKLIPSPDIMVKEEKSGKTPGIEGLKDVLKLPGIPSTSTLGESPLKKERLEHIRKTRFARLASKIVKVAIGEPPKPVKSLGEGTRIETDIDKVYSYIKKRKRVHLNQKLANELGVRREQLEEWAMILEEHNLVELYYPAIGEPEIRIPKR